MPISIVVINHVSLDGVMQGPARVDEDIRGGFSHGGWADAANDEAMVQAIGERMGTPEDGLLLGRRSYEDMLAAWNARGGPFKDGLNATPKYVASSGASTELEWPNSTLLHGDVPAAVAKLKQEEGRNLVIMGSGQLIRSLIPHGLIDEYLLMIHPLVLGSGQRLFEGIAGVAELQLVDSSATSTGVILAVYQPPLIQGFPLAWKAGLLSRRGRCWPGGGMRVDPTQGASPRAAPTRVSISR